MRRIEAFLFFSREFIFLLESLQEQEREAQRPTTSFFSFFLIFLCLRARILERERVSMRRPESYDLFLHLRYAARGIAAAQLRRQVSG
jgi:hypothetical protein